MNFTSFSDLGIDIPAGVRGCSIRLHCPQCSTQYRNRKKTLSVETERGLFHCFRCEWSGKAGSGGITQRRPVNTKLNLNSAWGIDKVWRESIPLVQSKQAIGYLKNRLGCLPSALPNIRAHQELRYYEDKSRYSTWIGIVAEVKDISGRRVSIHRTYLSDDGEKAPVESPRRIMPIPDGLSLKGTAIRLYEPTDTLVLTEGVETALALHMMVQQPVWACCSAYGLEAVQLPDTINTVMIGADNDCSGRGQLAANRLSDRLHKEGRDVEILLPDKVGEDWADVLVRRHQ